MFFFLVISCKKDKELVWCCSVISVERPVTDAITRSLVPQSVSFKKEVHRKKVGHSGSPVCFVVVQFVHHKRGKSKCRATEMNKQSRIKEGIYFDKEISRCGRENHHFQFREKGFYLFPIHSLLKKKSKHIFWNSTKQSFGSISQALTRRLYVTSSPLWTRVACVLVEEQKIHIDNDFSKRLFQVIGRALNYYNEVKERSLEKN